ncbi:MAG: T9SS type A sorting domain-containing protein [Candidatus Zixiibacteriota bacterium]
MRQSKCLVFVLFLVSFLLITSNIYGVKMKSQCIGAGGVIGSSSGSYKVSATVGQTAIGKSVNSYWAYHGFWNPAIITTDVEEDMDVILPGDFNLSQNYPNPFNPQTVIEYALPRDSRVSIVVYNVLGQKVKILKDEWEEAGYKSVSWDGTNQSGQEVGTGIYFYKIHACDFVKTKKMVLLK